MTRRWRRVMYERRLATRTFSSTCSVVVMPERATQTPGVASTKRRATSGAERAPGSNRVMLGTVMARLPPPSGFITATPMPLDAP